MSLDPGLDCIKALPFSDLQEERVAEGWVRLLLEKQKKEKKFFKNNSTKFAQTRRYVQLDLFR